MAETLGQRLRQAREERGWPQTYVSQITGISNISISNYERDFRKPDLQTLQLLAAVYGKSLDYLITGKDPELRQISLINWEKYVIRGSFTGQADDHALTMEIAMVPILKEPVSPALIASTDAVEGYLPVLANELDLTACDYFWWRVRDDAMSGENIPKGSLVLIRQCENTRWYANGSIRLVKIEQELTLRRVFEYDHVIALQASNPDYPLKLYDFRGDPEYTDGVDSRDRVPGYGVGEVIRIVQDVTVV